MSDTVPHHDLRDILQRHAWVGETPHQLGRDLGDGYTAIVCSTCPGRPWVRWEPDQ